MLNQIGLLMLSLAGAALRQSDAESRKLISDPKYQSWRSRFRMGKVRIVTDSNAYLSPEVLAKYKIEVIPHRLKIGSSLVEETPDFSADDLFAKLQESQTN